MAEPLRRFNTKVSYVKEVTYGTGVATTTVLPVTDFSETNTAEVIRDEGLRGIAARDFLSQQGVLHAELTTSGIVYADQFGGPLMSMFGTDTKTGSGPYTHAFAMAAIPPSYTVEGQQATASDDTLQYTGFKASKLSLTFEAATGALAYSWEGQSYVGVLATGTNPALPTFDAPFETWRGTIVSGTGSFAARLISAEIDFIRDLQVIFTAANVQNPYIIAQGPLGVEGTVTLTVADYADFALWAAHTNTSLVFTFDYGTDTAERTLAITISNANLGNAPVVIDRSGIGVTVKLSFLGIYNATDVGPAAVVLTNGITAAN